MAAYLISHFQTGLKNVLDRAILDHREVDRPGAAGAFPEDRRDPLRLPAADHVGGGGDAGGRAAAADQGRPGGNLPPLHPLRARRRRLPHGADHHRGPQGGVREPEQRRLPRAGRGLQGPRAAGGLLEGRRVGPDPDRLRGVPRPAQGDGLAGHRGAAAARRDGQDPHRRQRAGQPQDLPRGRPADRAHAAGRRRSRR